MHKIIPDEVQTPQATTVQTPEMKYPALDKKTRMIIGGVFLFLIAAGVLTGFAVSKKTASGGITTASVSTSETGGKIFGSTDTKTFTDSAVGVIEKDGQNGEGTHKLIRDGGPSQTACLVSSVLDLDEFVGKKVKVWSNTMDAKTCAWLMDVGRIELQ